MPHIITESQVEEAALEILEELGYGILHGPDIALDGPSPERQSYADVVLRGRLVDAMDRLNAEIPREARREAIKQILRVDSPDIVVNNRRFHKMLAEGVDVEFRKDGRVVTDKVRLFDFKDPAGSGNLQGHLKNGLADLPQGFPVARGQCAEWHDIYPTGRPRNEAVRRSWKKIVQGSRPSR